MLVASPRASACRPSSSSTSRRCSSSASSSIAARCSGSTSGISDPDIADEIAFPGWFDAREQIVAYAQRKNGLNGATTGPMPRKLRTWERFKRSR